MISRYHSRATFKQERAVVPLMNRNTGLRPECLRVLDGRQSPAASTTSNYRWSAKAGLLGFTGRCPRRRAIAGHGQRGGAGAVDYVQSTGGPFRRASGPHSQHRRRPASVKPEGDVRLAIPISRRAEEGYVSGANLTVERWAQNWRQFLDNAGRGREMRERGD